MNGDKAFILQVAYCMSFDTMVFWSADVNSWFPYTYRQDLLAASQLNQSLYIDHSLPVFPIIDIANLLFFRMIDKVNS